ncbi:MAG: MMPL family transporter [Pseudomonadota bacterium]
MLKIIESFIVFWTSMARRGGAALAVIIAVSACAAGYYAANNLGVNTDTSQMLDPELPFQKRAAELREAFPQTKTDVIVIARAPTLDEADAFIGDLRTRLVERPDAVSDVFATSQEPFFRENGLLFLDEDDLSDRMTQLSKAAGLIETLIKSPGLGAFFDTLAENDELAEGADLGQDTLDRIYTEVSDVIAATLNDEVRPFSWMGAIDEEMASKDAHSRLLYATPFLDPTRLQPAKPSIEVIRAELSELDALYNGRVEAYITGDPTLRMEELEAVTTGIGLSMALSLVLVSLLLRICFRSTAMAGLTLASLIITLLFTGAFSALIFSELNLVSIAFIVLLIGLGLDFAIHLLLHVQERRLDGQDNATALSGAVREVGPAIALAAPTTALAFVSFVPTRFDGIAQLGVIAGAGVIIAFFVSITFLPAAIAQLPFAKASKSGGHIRAGFRAFSKLSGILAIATILLGVLAVQIIPQARFDADQMSLRNPAASSVLGFNLLFEDPDTAPYRLTRIVQSEDDALATADRARALPAVSSTRALSNFVPEDQDIKLELIEFASAPLFFAFRAEPGSVIGPDRSESIERLRMRLADAHQDGSGARLAGLLNDLQNRNDDALLDRIEDNVFRYWDRFSSQLRAQMSADYVDADALPAILKARYLSDGGLWRVDILPEEDLRDPAALDAFVSDVEAAFPDLAGGAYQAKKAGDAISVAMTQATLTAFVVIALFLWLLVRRISSVALMLFPLGLAAILTIAASVLLNIPFNYANVIVLPLLIGIGVDSGIHLVMRQRQVEAGQDVYGTSTPRAVLFAALTTVASFGSLMLSPHRGTASMGELLSIAIAFTLICTLIVLPAAFNYAGKRDRLLSDRRNGSEAR